MHFRTSFTAVSNVVKISIQYVEEEHTVYVKKPRRKIKLNDLYPQRAILEESRSLRKNANDFIDNDYYERELEKTPERYARMLEKYGVSLSSE